MFKRVKRKLKKRSIFTQGVPNAGAEPKSEGAAFSHYSLGTETEGYGASCGQYSRETESKKPEEDPSENLDSNEGYLVSFEQSTEEIYGWEYESPWKMTIEDMLTYAREDPIIKFKCRGKIPPLDFIHPTVEGIILEDIPDISQLERLTSVPQLLWLHLVSTHGMETSVRNLPECLSSLIQLHSLVLNGHDFSAGLPKVIGNLTSLVKLDLNSCNLKSLPEFLGSLTRLKELCLSENNFSSGLLGIVGKLFSLEKLELNSCQLKDLPQSFQHLLGLKMLYMDENEFKELPSVVFHLKGLKFISVKYCPMLTRIDKLIVNLSMLTKLVCWDCSNLVSPPYGVCELGIKAIQEYFEAISVSEAIEVCNAPVAIVGNSLSGKTSIVRSLLSNKRVLTQRSESDISITDETTKGFEVHELKSSTSTLHLIDHGGQDIYHIAYQYIIKESNIPLFVVSLKQFLTHSQEKGPILAARWTCWDWMSHLYLACPLLGPPLLVLTHADAVAEGPVGKCKEKFLESIEQIRKDMLAEEKEQYDSRRGEFRKIQHLSNIDTPVFDSQEVFVFSNNELVISNIESLKSALDKRCQRFKRKIPAAWNEIAEFVSAQTDKSFIDVSLIEKKYPIKESHTVLKYMHNTGSILWFNKVDCLSSYVFHQISHITEMICLLFHHRSEENWKERIATFTAFRFKNRMISRGKYEEMVAEFLNDGMLDTALLYSLLTKGLARFPWNISVDLLKSFRILHGPVNKLLREYYLVPIVSKSFMDRSWEEDGDLQLRIELGLGGLAVPIYGFHLTTVKFLETHGSPRTTIRVRGDGATVYHGESATHFIHSNKDQKLTIQVSTSPNLLTTSWKRLIETSQLIIKYITSIWKACQPSVKVFCSHCLYLRDPQPGTFVDPDWLCPIFSSSVDSAENCDLQVCVEAFSGLEQVFCSKRQSQDETGREPIIPSPLVYPCYHLTTDESAKVSEYLSKITFERHTAPSAALSPNISSTSNRDTNGKNAEPRRPLRPDGDDSELSDDLEYLDETNDDLSTINLRVKPCRRAWAKALYDSPTVYRMSSPIRGRCLIINNLNFAKPENDEGSYRSNRPGSQKDVENIHKLFKRLEFTWDQIHADLSAKDMLSAIQKETEVPDHENYGMFVLVIMTHGTETHLYGSDCQLISRTAVHDLLSAQKFPLMAGKPKLLILQACSGGSSDIPYMSSTAFPSSAEPVQAAATVPLPSTGSSQFTNADTSDILAADDFFIMTPSFTGYISNRHPIQGSIFIRAIVEAFYKHSCHRDVKRLFEEQISKKVRAKSIAINRQDPTVGRQLATLICYPTDGKKTLPFPWLQPSTS